MPSERQIGLMEDGHMVHEPELCAVTGRDVRGKHAVTHYGPDGQFVYVLAQADHLWPLAAPAYGFPVPEEKPAQDEKVFVLDVNEGGVVPTGDNGVLLGGFLPPQPKDTPLSLPNPPARSPRASKSAETDFPQADAMSKGDD